jgi:hypothetical protein
LAAKPTRELPDQIFSSGKTTGTLVRTGKTFSSEGQILGILAPAGTVSVVKPVEQNDPALIGVVKTFVGRMNTNYTMVDQHPFQSSLHDAQPEIGRGP